MRATTNHGNHTLVAPAGGVKSGVPVYMSNFLAVVPQADAAEGELFAGISTGIEIAVDITGIAADVSAYQPVALKSNGQLVIGNPGANQAKFGVTKVAIDATQGNDADGAPVVAVQTILVMVQGI